MCLTFQVVATFHLASPALPLCLCAESLTEAKQLASRPVSALSSFPFNQILSQEKFALAVTLVLACIWGMVNMVMMVSVMKTNLLRAEGHTDRVIDRKDQRFIPLAPVLDNCNVYRGCAGYDGGRGVARHLPWFWGTGSNQRSTNAWLI